MVKDESIAGDEYMERITKSIDYRNRVKGEFLNHTNTLELSLDQIISNHFIKEIYNQVEFAQLFLHDRMTISRKKEILKFIVENNYPNFIKKAPDLLPKLQSLIEFRNKLAHGINALDGSETEQNVDYFSISYYSKGKMQADKITIKAIEDKEKDVDYINNMLSRLFMEVVQHEKP